MIHGLSLSFPSFPENKTFSCIFQDIFVSFQSLSNEFYFSQMFSDFIIVTIILFTAYLFHTVITLSISSNFIFVILLICCHYGLPLSLNAAKCQPQLISSKVACMPYWHILLFTGWC